MESNLLSQVRVANINQEIDVWVLGRTRVRLRVGKSIIPNFSTHFKLCISVSLDPSDKGKALLLTTSTEVSIAPKTRAKPQASQNNGAKSPVPKEKGAIPSVPAPSRPKKNTQILRSLPIRSVPLLKIFSSIDDSLAYVSRATFLELTGRVGQVELQTHRAEIKRIRPPVDPSGTPGAPVPAAPSVTKLLNSQTKEEEKPKSDLSVLLVTSDQVPDRHILLSNSVDGVEDFDLVRCVVRTLHLALILTRVQDNSRSRRSQHGHYGGADAIASPGFLGVSPSTFIPSTCLMPFSRTPSSSRPVLAGLDEILRRCTGFCTRTFLIHSSAPAIHGGQPDNAILNSIMLTRTSSFGDVSRRKVRRWKDFNCQDRWKISGGRSEHSFMYVKTH